MVGAMSVLQPVRASGPGVEISACPHGAHLLSWRTSGIERLWMSPVSKCGEATALRGGVPVLFPQFGTFGHLPKHGFARTSEWRTLPTQSTPGEARLAFELHDSAHTRSVWPHPFRATVDVTATDRDLTIGLTVTNLDEYDARFTAGLHTYFAIADPQAWVGGLGGRKAWNGEDTADPVFDQPLGEHLLAVEERDAVVQDCLDPVFLHDAVLGDLAITADGFPDRVVWNPGPGQRLPDVPPGLEAGFVCIEPVQLTPFVLGPGQTWSASSTATVVQG